MERVGSANCLLKWGAKVFRSISEEIKDILNGVCLVLGIEFGVAAFCAGDGQELLVLDVEYLCPESTGRSYFSGLVFHISTFRTFIAVDHKVTSCELIFICYVAADNFKFWIIGAFIVFIMLLFKMYFLQARQKLFILLVSISLGSINGNF